MIDLTPLDVRKKRGDFRKGLRGYDPQEVDGFLELVAERMEELVKENLAFREKIGELAERVVAQEGREKAVQEALVTAQELRQDVKKQASREAKLLEREARSRIEGMIGESEKQLTDHRAALQELERQRERFLKAFRTFLERELDTVEVEFGRAPLEDSTQHLELGKSTWAIGADEDGRGQGAGEAGGGEGSDEDENHGRQEAEDDHGTDDGVHRDSHDEPRAETPAAETAGEDDDVSAPASADATESGVSPDTPPAAGKVKAEADWLSSIMDPKDEDAE